MNVTPDDFSSALEAAQHYVDICRWMNLDEAKGPTVEKIIISQPRKIKIEFHCNDKQVFELPKDDAFFGIFLLVLRKEMDAAQATVTEVERQKKAEQFS